jgi:glycine cleavage system H protein
VSEYPTDLRYTNDHEWVRAEGDRWRVGITSFAAKQLGDVVFIELPKVGDAVERSAPIGTIESVKAVSEIYAPISGKIVAVNDAVRDDPESVNTDPHGAGWLVEIEPSVRAELDELMTAEAYGKHVAEAE